MKALIRIAERRDAVAAWDTRNAAILAQCAGHYPEDELATWTSGVVTEQFIQSVAENWYVATVDNMIIGTGALNCVTGQIDAIFVHPDMMGNGIGRQIMAFLERLAIQTGLTRLTLDSTLNAAPFYRLCGFVGDHRSVYNSPRGISLACISMTKQLS
jgi:GNAT superfamily N-acetyltransferase